ncbi:MAG: LPS export ABC transporter periplasmic protein LptC [Steroidobacteraceae bacterium]|nr:LPS export ABC transporter periplasmic protein LptC [Steroidobacteraceae bacterium]MDW8257908.1 LPS export ABC transporter periplasmic protein LptC [Gammaproteobacteria bacterium]
MTRRNGIAAALCAASVALAGCDAWRDTQASAARSTSAGTGYSATNAEIVETDAAGEPRYRLRAGQVNQHHAQTDIELHDVTLDVVTRDGGSWVLRADHGRLSPPRERAAQRVDLNGNVVLQGALGRTGQSLRLQAETLRYEPSLQLASSRGPVTISFGPHVLTSHGLQANLASGRLRLESQVHGRFRPP